MILCCCPDNEAAAFLFERIRLFRRTRSVPSADGKDIFIPDALTFRRAGGIMSMEQKAVRKTSGLDAESGVPL